MASPTIKDSVVFVTGANRGIGRAIVEELVKNGAKKVYATARNINSLDELVAAHNGKVVSLRLDVTKPEQITTAAAQAQDTTLLINNAGIANYSAIINSYDTARGRQEMEVNYFGLMNVTRAFAPILKKNDGGVLVNISSIIGLVPAPAVGTYSATKAAVHSLTKSVRYELKDQGTHVLCVYPGAIDTEMAAGFDVEKDTPQNVAQAIFAAIESGAEEVFPDKGSREFAEQFKADPKAVEREWGQMLPETLKEIIPPPKPVAVAEITPEPEAVVTPAPEPQAIVTPEAQDEAVSAPMDTPAEESVASIADVLEEKSEAVATQESEKTPEPEPVVEETIVPEPVAQAAPEVVVPPVIVPEPETPKPQRKGEEIMRKAGDTVIRIVVE